MLATVALLLSLVDPTAPRQSPSTAAADSAYRARDWSTAARLYREATSTDSTNARTWYRLGASEHNRGKYQLAVDAFERAIAVGTTAPGSSRGLSWYGLAAARARLGRRDLAMQALDSSIAGSGVLPSQLANDPDLASLRSDPQFKARERQVTLAMFPCDTMVGARQFDFWIGDWDVYTTSGQLAGRNKIERILRGCVIQENWESSFGSAGKSFNWYNIRTGRWQQTWVADGASSQEYREGKLEGSTLVFHSDRPGPQGQTPIKIRLSFTPLTGNRVRQHQESSSDGQTWNTVYDFEYIRHGTARR